MLHFQFYKAISLVLGLLYSLVHGVLKSAHVPTNCKIRSGANFYRVDNFLVIHADQTVCMMCSLFYPIAAGIPSNVCAVLAGPTSFTVSWTAPASGANVTGYRIYWSGGSDQGSVDASATDNAVTISGRSRGLVYYTISMVALSDHLPSPVVGPITVNPW